MEQLFRLGLRSRAECEELLQRCQLNLEQASALMLDTYGPHRNKYADLAVRTMKNACEWGGGALHVRVFLFLITKPSRVPVATEPLVE